jgi:hypothetical protein
MITLFYRDGRPITTIHTETERSHVLNSEGKCTFPFALTDPKARLMVLNTGNLILITQDRLPDWGGVIDGDQDWEEDGTLSLTAWSGAHLLYFRRSPTNQVWTAGSAGALLWKLMTHANSAEDLLIRRGSIWEGGGPRQDTMDGKNLYTHAVSIAQNAKVDWSLDPALDANGHIYFALNVWPQQGVVSNLVLKEGHNLEKRGKPLKVRYGNVVNDLLGLGDASTDDRPEYAAPIDEVSRGQIGLRQGTEDFEGNSDPGTLKANTEASLKVRAQPERIIQATALDVGNTFAELGVGNIHPYVAQTHGFKNDGQIGMDTWARVIGMRPSDKTREVELTLAEVLL